MHYPSAHTRNTHNQLLKPIVRFSLTLIKSHQLFKSNNAVSNQILQVVLSYPSSPPIAASTMVGIYVIPVVALYCSAHVYCAVELGIACYATHHTAIVTLTKTTIKTKASKGTNLGGNAMAIKRQCSKPKNGNIQYSMIV